jgi:hypothetical protein
VATAEVKTGLDGSDILAVTTSFLGEAERETDLEDCLGLSSESKSLGSRVIVLAAEDFVGANNRDLVGSRWEDDEAKGWGPLAR